MSLSLCAWAQPHSSDNSAQAVIRYLKNVSAASFDSRLPRVSLADFLSYETGAAGGKWTVVQRETGTDPAGKDARKFLTCVQAEYDLKTSEHPWTPGRSLSGGGLLTALVRVERLNKGQFRDPTILNLTITDVTGSVHQVRRLGDVPMELQRLPAITPKDLLVPAGSGS